MTRLFKARSALSGIRELRDLYDTYKSIELGMPEYRLVADSPFVMYVNGYLYEGPIENLRFMLPAYIGRERPLADEFESIASRILLNRFEECIDLELFRVRCLEVEEIITRTYYHIASAHSATLAKSHLLN